MKRNIAQFETKCEENKNALDEMYEKKVSQDRKIIQM